MKIKCRYVSPAISNLGLDCDTNLMMVSPYGDAGNAGKYNSDDDIIGEDF